MTGKQLTLYGELSPNVRKVCILLEELGLNYDLRHVAVLKGEQFRPDFLAMSPFAKVPVLVDPELDLLLFESGAILIYLAERHGRFLPLKATNRYETMAWLIAQMAYIGPMIGQLNHFLTLPSGTEPYALGRYRSQATRIYRVLEERVSLRQWIAGEEYSIADMAIYPWAAALEMGGFVATDYPALVRWCDAMARRPAVQRCDARMTEALGESSEKCRKSATPADLDRFFGRTKDMPPADYSAVTQ